MKGPYLNLRWASWKRLPAWLFSLRKSSSLVAVCFAAWIVPRWACAEAEPVDAWRYTGWVLDIAGLWTVVWGISARLAHYRGEHLPAALWRDVLAVLRSFPLLRQYSTLNLGTSKVALWSGGRADMILHRSPRPDASLEEKVDFLLEQNKLRQEAVVKLEGKLASINEHVERQVAKIEAKLASKVDAVKSEQEKVAVEGAGWELVGLVWIMFGITCATIPEALVWLLG